MEHKNRAINNKELKESIITTALQTFLQYGIKSITMDKIASLVGISKRTLYEIFSDKEQLLKDCLLKRRSEFDKVIKNVVDGSNNVLEIILNCYLKSIEDFHQTHVSFHQDLKKYPKLVAYWKKDNEKKLENMLTFFDNGVKQEFFRPDINYRIVNTLFGEQIRLLMDTNVFMKYSFLEVYESIMFTFLRGICTNKGQEVLEVFVKEHSKK